jgi:predicted transcriptional regulator
MRVATEAHFVTRRKSNADLMREWRALAGVNAAAAGERLGLSGRAIEDIEQGRRRDGDELTRLGLLRLIDDENVKKKD